MKRFSLSVVTLFILITGSSQDFGTDAGSKYILKDVDAITPPHEYFQLLNFTGDTLPIRWKVNQALTFYPPEWVLAIQDNETYFNPIVDSNDVEIIDSAGTMDKIILNVFPNQTVGYGELVIDLINLDSTQEVHQIKFEMDIFQDGVGVNENEKNDQWKVYPNPCLDQLQIETGGIMISECFIYSLDGKCLLEKTGSINTSLDVGFLLKGSYFLQFRSEDGSVHTFPFFKE